MRKRKSDRESSEENGSPHVEESKMRVGVLTWFFAMNYGAKAQCYALQQSVQRLGYDALVINYTPKNAKKICVNGNLNVKNRKYHPVLLMECLLRCRKFEKALGLYNLTKRVESAEEIDELNLDGIVLGSDAIFNLKHPLGSGIYYGVGITQTPLVTYSPSCEYLPRETVLPEDIKASINCMHAISVRDRNTQYLIKNNCDLDVPITLDPTLLYDFEDIQSSFSEENYILVYTFADWSIYKEQLQSFAKQKNLKIVSVGKYYKWADVSYNSASFEEWVTAFRNASYVFTDSFHGTVFSIKNSKEMILVNKSDKTAKICSLLEDVGITRRFYDGSVSIEKYLADKIDYDLVREKLEFIKERSLDYLKQSLNKIKCRNEM